MAAESDGTSMQPTIESDGSGTQSTIEVDGSSVKPNQTCQLLQVGYDTIQQQPLYVLHCSKN